MKFTTHDWRTTVHCCCAFLFALAELYLLNTGTAHFRLRLFIRKLQNDKFILRMHEMISVDVYCFWWTSNVVRACPLCSTTRAQCRSAELTAIATTGRGRRWLCLMSFCCSSSQKRTTISTIYNCHIAIIKWWIIDWLTDALIDWYYFVALQRCELCRKLVFQSFCELLQHDCNRLTSFLQEKYKLVQCSCNVQTL